MAKVSPKLSDWLNNYNKGLNLLMKSGFKFTPTNAREGLARLTHLMVLESPDIPWIQDDLVNAPVYAVPVRIYHPEPHTSLPVLIYFHGGGHVAGSVSIYDPICKQIASATRHIVVSVDYRLAPECPYPAGVQDALWTAKNIWPSLDAWNLNCQRRLSIAGDSSGGALCATVSHLSQFDPGLKLSCQILVYPSLDYTLSTASVDENGFGFFLQRDKIEWFFDNYFLHGENRKNASPLFMEFSSKLPDTLMITTDLCPLRDEGAAYMEKVKKTGVRWERLHFSDMLHAFLNMENLVAQECELVYHTMDAFLNFKNME